MQASHLNLKHLRYFWTVAKTGSMARAAEQLNLTPQSISGQIAELEIQLNTKLLRRKGRGTELTETGARVLGFAEDIFNVSDELIAHLSEQPRQRALEFRVGIADSMSKSVAHQLLSSALELPEPVRLLCSEGQLANLLAELAVHRLDLVIADRAMPTELNVRGFSHLLGETSSSFVCAKSIRKSLKGKFPDILHDAPMLLPGRDFAVRKKLDQWLDRQRIRPKIIGEFDDSALLKEFASAGVGIAMVPSAIARLVCQRYQCVLLGNVSDLVQQTYAISSERRMTHPAMVAIREVAKVRLFHSPPRA
jgi:LysR family transcriptional regulator, transcriptional activator of nhaA